MSNGSARNPDPIPRRSGRVIVVDDAGRVLLLSDLEPLPDGTSRMVWVLPGGGAEEGEDGATAAARELAEETGLQVPPERLRGPVATARGAWHFRGVDYWSEDAFFLLRVPAWDMAADDLGPLDRAAEGGHRWWTADELARTDAIIYPRGLAPLVARLSAGDVPPQPVALPW